MINKNLETDILYEICKGNDADISKIQMFLLENKTSEVMEMFIGNLAANRMCGMAYDFFRTNCLLTELMREYRTVLEAVYYQGVHKNRLYENEVKKIAEVLEEKTLIKPEFKEEINAEIIGTSKIEDNIKKVKEYAIKVKEYYTGVVFTAVTKNDAEKEKADINKFKKQVEDFRKQIVAKYNEPIKLFEDTAKETEKLLKETYNLINVQVKAFDDEQLEKVREKIESYFNEYAQSKNIDFVNFSQMNISVTKGLLTSTGNLTKKVQDQINEFVDRCAKDVDLINTLEHKEEILIEYKKNLKSAESIALVMDRYKQLEEMKQEKESAKEQVINDEEMLKKIDSLSAPKVQRQDEIVLLAFEFIGPKESAKIVANTLKSIEGKYRQLRKVEDHYE